MEERIGLVIVYTGNGKGKTTAALGLALRATGQGFRVLMLQFIKSGRNYGELEAARNLPGLEIVPMGRGFVKTNPHPRAEDLRMARTTYETAREKIRSGAYDMVILDEINYAVQFGLLTVEDVLELIRSKPTHVHLVLTGRNARPEVVEMADLVTEMREIKHPYQRGVKAQKGIEF